MFQTDGAGNDSAYLPLFIASGASHATGLVPDPGAVPGTTNFLREDATWAVPPGAGGTAFQSLQRQTTILADGSTTTFGVLGDAITFDGFFSPTKTAAPGTSTRGAALIVVPGGTGTFLWHTNDYSGVNSNYYTGRNLRVLIENFYTTTADNLNWIYFGDPFNYAASLSSGTPGASSGVQYAGFRFSNLSGGGPDTHWQACHAGPIHTDTVTDTGITPDTGSHQFAVVFTDSVPNITFYIDGALVATHTTNLPAANRPFALCSSGDFASTTYNVGTTQALIGSTL